MDVVYRGYFYEPYNHSVDDLGYTSNLGSRLELHKSPDGSSHHRLMQVIAAAGIGWRLVRTWPGDRTLERQLKRRKASPRLCPLCCAAAKSSRPRFDRSRAANRHAHPAGE